MTTCNASPHSASSLARLAHGLPLSPRYLGFGLYWGWIWILLNGSTLFAASAHSLAEIDMLRFVGTAARVPPLIAALLFMAWLSRPAGRRLLLIVTCLLGPLSTFAIVLGQQLSGTTWLLVSLPGWIAMGIASASMTWLWAMFLSSIDLRRACLYLSASVPVGAVIYFFTTSLPHDTALFITAALPVISAGAFFLASDELALGEAVESVTSRRRFPKVLSQFLGGIGIYAAAFGLLKGLGTPLDSQLFDSTSRLSVAGVGIVGTLLMTGILVLSRTQSLALIYRLILPTTVAGFLLLPFVHTDRRMFASAVIAVGFECLDIMSGIVLFGLAHRLRQSRLKVFGIQRLIISIGISAGWAVSSGLLGTASLGQDSLTALSLATVFLLVLVTVLLFNERELLLTLRFADGDTESVRSSAAETTGAFAHTPGPWRQLCSEIAAKHGLTSREEEVLALLARGHSAEFIGKTLFVSTHTAKAHTLHIYRKLNLHSREELINLLENMAHPHDDCRQKR